MTTITELVCQLCGVSFAVARLRREDEPLEAAWSKYNRRFVDFRGREVRCDRGGCRHIQHTEGFDARSVDDDRLEHLVGPGCTSDRGYSGHRISVEEMKGCKDVQCVMKKIAATGDNGEMWSPEPDDQDFELTSEYFLTGVGNITNIRYFDGQPATQHLYPVRHNTRRFRPTNAFRLPDWNRWGPSYNDDLGIPFHPSCFEIFKKISLQRLGKVDIHGLWSWREIEPLENQFLLRFPHVSAVKNARRERWPHKPGWEYLVANPIDIPGLSSVLESCQSNTVAHHVNLKLTMSLVTNRGASSPENCLTNINMDRCFASPCIQPPHSELKRDHFTTLPNELRHIILNHLSGRDIANLRLVTPAFRQLPLALFRRLLFEDMPYMFEAEDMPIRTTDWFRLYMTVKSSGQNLKGLQNRKRIWKVVTEIVTRIENYRKNGKIIG